MWGFIVFSLRFGWVVFLFLNLLGWDKYRREAAENYFRLKNTPVFSQYVGCVIQSAWMFGAVTWLLFDFDFACKAFIAGTIFFVSATYSGIKVAKSIERLQGTVP